MFLQTDTPTTICRKHQRLLTVNASVIRILRQIKRQLINTIGRQRTDTINHNINISQLRRAYQAARPRMLSAPQLCIAATHPQNPGEDPLTVQAMTIPDQIRVTRDTYGQQMAPPPGKPLFYGALYHDAAGPTGVNMHPHRHFSQKNTSRNTTLYPTCSMNTPSNG